MGLSVSWLDLLDRQRVCPWEPEIESCSLRLRARTQASRAGYNRSALKPSFFCCFILAFLGSAAAGAAQVRTAAATPGETVVVLPFENESKAPGLEWISESFPEVLGHRLAAAPLYVMSREDRNSAFDRAGIPSNARLSRATLYRIVEQMDANYVVLGDFNYDGQTFTAAAQVLDMKRLRLSPELKESGTLVKLIEVQTALASDVLKVLRPGATIGRDVAAPGSEAIRLDAFENYIRGLVAASRPLKIKHLREAIRLNANYTDAILALGRTYFDAREYDSAASWLAKVPKDDPGAREANFYLGLSAYYQADFEKAERAFSFVASQLPLTEVYNNLGVVAGRRGKRSELEYFQKAVQADAGDSDYQFNLAVALYRAGDAAAASRRLREALALRPTDGEARSLLETISANGIARVQGQPAVSTRIPPARIKRNYDETSYQQLALEVENATERRLANTEPRYHASVHVERGREFLKQGFWPQAEKEFREAVLLDPANAGAHAGLARALEEINDPAKARSEAEAAIRLQPTAEALLVLARLAFKANQIQQAQDNVERALDLEPKNDDAMALKRALSERTLNPPR